MIRIQDISKSYGPQVLFDEASLQMGRGERLGLIGRNGFGKSTLFRLILDEEHPDSGLITKPRNYRIGHLAQHLHFTKPTVLEEACLGLLPDEEHDHYKAERILFGLGFTENDMWCPPEQFSGGFQIRLNLAKVLVSHPDLLLLDEPTNYLDIISIRWITKFLRAWPGEMILISHDREFMDSVTTHTALINRCQIRKVEGDTAKLYELVAQEDETYEKTRANEDKKRKHAEAFINRFRAQAGRAAMVQSRLKMLERMPEREKLTDDQDLDFNFHYSGFEAKTMMEINDLSFGYPDGEPLFSSLTLQVQAHDRIAVIGKNGKGKSTLLNVLAGELKGQGTIYTHPNVRLGYFGQTNIARLDPKLTVEGEIDRANTSLGRTAVRSICGLMMFSGEAAEKRVSNLSGGEKSRVLLGKILAQPANLLFLDEPTNHLDMSSIEALIESIEVFEGAVVVVTHSEEILRRVATKLVVFQHGNVEIFDGTYDEFLEMVGWEEEENEKSAKQKKKAKAADATPTAAETPVNKKEIRKQKAQSTAEMARVLNPLQKEISTLEEEITCLEKNLAAANEELIGLSQNKNIDGFVALSKRIKETQKLIDEKFSQLEKVSAKFEEKKRELEGE